MIRAKYGHELRAVTLQEVEILINRIRGPLVPILSGTHLCRHRSDEVFAEKVAGAPTAIEMLEKGLVFKLRQNIDQKNAEIKKIGQKKINDPIAAAERHGGFSPVLCQR